MIAFPKSLILILFLSCAVYSQKRIDPTLKDIEKATAIKALFPDDDVALISSADVISFQVNTKKKKVEVTHKIDEHLINLDSRSDIQKYIFYDGESEIEKFEIRYKNKKRANFLIKDEAFTSDDLFHNDSRVKYANLDFPLKGYRYFTKIEKHIKDLKYFTSLYFNDDHPIVEKTITINVPDWLNLELKDMNFEGYEVLKTVSVNKQANGKVYTYTVKNIPARFDDENAPGPSYIYPHILILAKSFKSVDENVVLFNSTQNLYNWYYSLVKSLKNDNTAIVEKVTELTKNAKTDQEKIKNIYYWVQDNIRYIAFLDGIAGFKPDEASSVFHKRYGDCKGMANLTKQMLVEAGFDARLTWVGTKYIAYDYSTPNLSVDNHMICTLFKDGKTIFLDATEKYNAFGEYADRIQGKQVMIENGEDFILKAIPSAKAEANKEKFNYNLTISNNQEIIGTVDKNFSGESRSSLLYYFNNLKNDNRNEFLEYYLNQGNSNIEISNINTSDLLNRDQEIDIDYDVSIKNSVVAFDNQIYIDLDFDKELSNYKMEKRHTDFVFSSKKDLESLTILKIPKGYTVEHLPKNLAVSSNNYNMKVEFQQIENALVYKKQFKIKNAKIETTEFKQWNQFIDQLNAIYNEQIILIKN